MTRDKSEHEHKEGRDAARRNLAPEPWRTPSWWRGYSDETCPPDDYDAAGGGR